MSVAIQQKSGVGLGFLEEHRAGEDHPDHAEALQRALQVDARLAAFQKQRKAILSDERKSWLAKQEEVAALAQTELVRLGADAPISDGLFLRVARAHAGEAEWVLVQRAAPADAAAAIRAVEIRSRFGAFDETKRLDVLRRAIDRHEPTDLAFLQALLADGDLMGLLPAGIAQRIGRIVLELANPDAFQRWVRLVEQLDRFEEVLTTARRYVQSDANLSPTKLAEQERAEEIRRAVALSRAAGPQV